MADKPCTPRKRAINNGYSRQWNPRTKRVDYAHRVAWEKANGPIPEGYEVHHSCNTPLCVLVEHLECVKPDDHRIGHGKKSRAEHGTYSRYVLGCRCDACRTANRTYHRAYEARRRS